MKILENPIQNKTENPAFPANSGEKPYDFPAIPVEIRKKTYFPARQSGHPA